MKMTSEIRMKEEKDMISIQEEEITTRQTTVVRRSMMKTNLKINLKILLHLEANNTVNIMK